MFTHLKLCLADAIHNFKWVKIIQILQNGGQLFSNRADWCHSKILTCIKGGTKCGNNWVKNPIYLAPAVKGLSSGLRPTITYQILSGVETFVLIWQPNSSVTRASLRHLNYFMLKLNIFLLNNKIFSITMDLNYFVMTYMVQYISLIYFFAKCFSFII